MKKLLIVVMLSLATSVSVNAQMLSPNLSQQQSSSLFSRNAERIVADEEDPFDRGLGGGGGGDTPIGGAILPLAVFAGIYLFVRRDDAV